VDPPTAFFPLPQNSQTLCPSSPLTNPPLASQSVQTLAAIELYFPISHWVHEDDAALL